MLICVQIVLTVNIQILYYSLSVLTGEHFIHHVASKLGNILIN